MEKGVGKRHNERKLIRVKLRQLLNNGITGQDADVVSEFGYTAAELLNHLLCGVTCNNTLPEGCQDYHIDHILPLAIFDNPKDFRANSLNNLQLLSESDHLIKTTLEAPLFRALRSMKNRYRNVPK